MATPMTAAKAIAETEVTIRSFDMARDFPMVSDWWKAHNEPGPLSSMIPPTTWVLELDSVPALSVSVICTNISEYCLVDNLIGNPELKSPARARATATMLQYIENFARQQGFKRLFCFSYRPKLKELYERLGFGRTLDGVSTFVKNLE